MLLFAHSIYPIVFATIWYAWLLLYPIVVFFFWMNGGIEVRLCFSPFYWWRLAPKITKTNINANLLPAWEYKLFNIFKKNVILRIQIILWSILLTSFTIDLFFINLVLYLNAIYVFCAQLWIYPLHECVYYVFSPTTLQQHIRNTTSTHYYIYIYVIPIQQ